MAQRRRRVFVVGHLGDWRPPAAVLFERESLQWNPPPRREAGDGITGRAEGGTSSGGIAKPLTSHRFDFETETFVTHTLRGEGFDASEDGTGRGTPLVPMAYTTKLHNTKSIGAGKLYPEYTAGLDRNSPPPALVSSMAVRRLTPRECERLQGFPDDYTLIPLPLRGRQTRIRWAADGPRYKALGNSMAVPCMRWIGERIAAVESIQPRTPT